MQVRTVVCKRSENCFSTFNDRILIRFFVNSQSHLWLLSFIQYQAEWLCNVACKFETQKQTFLRMRMFLKQRTKVQKFLVSASIYVLLLSQFLLHQKSDVHYERRPEFSQGFSKLLRKLSFFLRIRQNESRQQHSTVPITTVSAIFSNWIYYTVLQWVHRNRCIENAASNYKTILLY